MTFSANLIRKEKAAGIPLAHDAVFHHHVFPEEMNLAFTVPPENFNPFKSFDIFYGIYYDARLC
jgi:hypothetical protein